MNFFSSVSISWVLWVKWSNLLWKNWCWKSNSMHSLNHFMEKRRGDCSLGPGPRASLGGSASPEPCASPWCAPANPESQPRALCPPQFLALCLAYSKSHDSLVLSFCHCSSFCQIPLADWLGELVQKCPAHSSESWKLYVMQLCHHQVLKLGGKSWAFWTE